MMKPFNLPDKNFIKLPTEFAVKRKKVPDLKNEIERLKNKSRFKYLSGCD